MVLGDVNGDTNLDDAIVTNDSVSTTFTVLDGQRHVAFRRRRRERGRKSRRDHDQYREQHGCGQWAVGSQSLCPSVHCLLTRYSDINFAIKNAAPAAALPIKAICKALRSGLIPVKRPLIRPKTKRATIVTTIETSSATDALFVAM